MVPPTAAERRGLRQVVGNDKKERNNDRHGFILLPRPAQRGDPGIRRASTRPSRCRQGGWPRRSPTRIAIARQNLAGYLDSKVRRHNVGPLAASDGLVRGAAGRNTGGGRG